MEKLYFLFFFLSLEFQENAKLPFLASCIFILWEDSPTDFEVFIY